MDTSSRIAPSAEPFNAWRTPDWRAWAEVPAVCLLAVLVVYPGLIAGRELPISSELDGSSDLFGVGLPLRAWVGRAMAEGRLPLWFPGSYGGQALAAIPEAVPYYPLSTLFYVFLDPTRATAWSLALHLILAGLGAGLLARRFGANAWGMRLTAIAVAVGLWLPGHFRQMNEMQTAAWAPWVWLAADRLIARPRPRAAAELGLAAGMMTLAGHIQLVHHTAVVMMLWCGARLILAAVARDETARLWPEGKAPKHLAAVAGATLLAAGLAIALAAPQFFPMLELAGLANREAMYFIDARPRYLWTLLNPFVYGGPVSEGAGPNPFYQVIYWVEAQYVGLLPLVLGLGALALSPWSRARRGPALSLLLIVVASLGLAYAHLWTPARLWFEAIPGARMFRFPQRYLWFVSLGLAVAAGIGLTGVLKWLEAHKPKLSAGAIRAAGLAVLVQTLFDLAPAVSTLAPVGDARAFMTEPASLKALAAAGARRGAFGERIATFDGPAISRASIRGSRGWHGPPAHDAELYRFFRHQHPSLWDWRTVRGHVGLAPGWSALAIGDQHMPGNLFWLDVLRHENPEIATAERWAQWAGFMGARWAVSRFPLVAPNLRPVDELRGKLLDTYLYENLDWPGPAWIARETAVTRTEKDAQAYLFARDGDYHEQIVTTGEPPRRMNRPQVTPHDRIELENPRPELVIVDCDLESDGYLVLNLNYHPRWRVSVDGCEPFQPIRANLMQTAVLLTEGRHRVEFRYAGTREKIGLAVAALALISVCLCMFPLRPRRLTKPKPTET